MKEKNVKHEAKQWPRLKRSLIAILRGIKPSEIVDVATVLIEEGFDVASREALNRLGVQWESGSAEQAYNSGQSQQVPAHNIVQLKSRFRRKLTYQDRKLHFEGNVNAR